ncbi:MAG: restriction endonuclease [Fimbriimonadaceae bacterium]|nr:restriction endonuclease [Fimbriimonadaceae bacterium]
MNLNDIQKALFVALWHVHAEHGPGGMDWQEWSQGQGHDVKAVGRAFDELSELGLVEAASLGPYAQITVYGLSACEQGGFIDEESLKPHTRFRMDLLVALSRVRAEQGLSSAIYWGDLIQDIGADAKLFNANDQFLTQTGYMEWIGQSLRITAKGESAVQEYLSKRGLLDRFEELKATGTVTAQQRGHELEKLLELAATSEGWNVVRNARAPGEENDLILSKGFDYFIVSCKWLSGACEVEDARSLRDRVVHRPGTRGVLCSMSGFTAGFEGDIERRLSDAIILPFGPGDIENALSGKLTALLQSKLHGVIVNRVFPWS